MAAENIQVKKEDSTVITSPMGKSNTELVDKKDDEIDHAIIHKGLNEIDDSDITTKIYKSSDPSTKLLEEQFSIDTTIDDDILSKDELIRGKDQSKRKIIQRKVKLEEDSPQRNKNNFSVLPFVCLIGLIIFLILIFKLVKMKKL